MNAIANDLFASDAINKQTIKKVKITETALQ